MAKQGYFYIIERLVQFTRLSIRLWKENDAHAEVEERLRYRRSDTEGSSLQAVWKGTWAVVRERTDLIYVRGWAVDKMGRMILLKRRRRIWYTEDAVYRVDWISVLAYRTVHSGDNIEELDVSHQMTVWRGCVDRSICCPEGSSLTATLNVQQYEILLYKVNWLHACVYTIKIHTNFDINKIDIKEKKASITLLVWALWNMYSSNPEGCHYQPASWYRSVVQHVFVDEVKVLKILSIQSECNRINQK